MAIEGRVKEKIELIEYDPAVKNTGDLEAGTKVIAALTEQAVADYSAALTLPIPTDARLIIKRIASRLNVQGAVTGTPSLRCRVYVDSQIAANRLLDVTVGVSTDYLTNADLTSGAIFTLLTNGAAHTFLFFFWDPNYVAATHEYTISLVQLWEGVANSGTTRDVILEINHHGLQSVILYTTRIGTGTGTGTICPVSTNLYKEFVGVSSGAPTPLASVMSRGLYIRVNSTVATDLVGLNISMFQLRSEQ